MATVLIVGDGPAGLSAALFIAKADHQAVVLGQDDTPMHHALIANYLGMDPIRGSDFQTAARAQVAGWGTELLDEEIQALEVGAEGVVARGSGGERAGDYVVLAGGKNAQRLATTIGVTVRDGRVVVDEDQRTSIDRVYAVGRATRPHRSQAIISAGAGAIAALDILSREAGRDVHDWDTPPEHDHDHPTP
jgi:thioredoxin reductase (NADPH)